MQTPAPSLDEVRVASHQLTEVASLLRDGNSAAVAVRHWYQTHPQRCVEIVALTTAVRLDLVAELILAQVAQRRLNSTLALDLARLLPRSLVNHLLSDGWAFVEASLHEPLDDVDIRQLVSFADDIRADAALRNLEAQARKRPEPWFQEVAEEIREDQASAWSGESEVRSLSSTDTWSLPEGLAAPRSLEFLDSAAVQIGVFWAAVNAWLRDDAMTFEDHLGSAAHSIGVVATLRAALLVAHPWRFVPVDTVVEALVDGGELEDALAARVLSGSPDDYESRLANALVSRDVSVSVTGSHSEMRRVIHQRGWRDLDQAFDA